jgi:phasin
MTAQARTGTDAAEALRDLAEKSAAQAKENLETMSSAAEEATDVLKHSYATTVTGIQDYSTKVLEFTNTNIKAAVEHATKLMSVKTPTEFFTLSNDYAKRQFEILTRQAQELAAIVQKMTTVKDR